MIRKLGFFLLSLLGKKTDGTRETGGLDGASTDFVQQRFLWPERGKLEYFFFLLFQLEREGGKGREDIFLKTSGERKREKETLDRTNSVGLISLWYSLFFTITLQMFICFVLTFFFF